MATTAAEHELETELDENGGVGRRRASTMTLYRDLDATAFSDDSHWVNLGLWTSTRKEGTPIRSRFTEANENLATRIGDMAIGSSESKPIDTLIDIGCGNGDSLLLWTSAARYGQIGSVIGVNSSRAEYLFAAERFSGDAKVSLHFSDAVEFVDEKIQSLKLKNFAIISVDAMYHFPPSRKDFLSACRSSGASRIAMSDIVLSEKWARETDRMDFLTTSFRKSFIQLICLASGIPLANLSYGPSELSRVLGETGWKQAHFEVVTGDVFKPFSSYCFERAAKFSWFSKPKWTLMSSGLFMGLLGWLHAVDFVLYAADPS